MSDSGLTKEYALVLNARSIRPSANGLPLPVARQPTVSIKLLGGLSVSAGGIHMPLPASRRTRALLGYLVLTATSQCRERLCELLWEAPDDPRGALRWSLSKLRPIINFDGRERLRTGRDRIALLLDDIDVDVHRIKTCAETDSTPERLSWAWQATTESLLQDCELADLPSFCAWLQSERRGITVLRAAIAKRLALSGSVTPDDAVVWADRWRDDRPLDTEAAQAVVTSRRRAGRIEEALQRASELELVFRKAGFKAPSFATDALERAPANAAHLAPPHDMRQRRPTVRFARAPGDDACLAWASVGAEDAPPLVKAANWLTHLELDWDTPVWGPLYQELTNGYRLVRYDERGCGLSEWNVPEINFNTFVTDLQTVVDAAGLDRFPLLGISHGAAVSIEYAARHPDRVRCLILLGAYPAGWRHVGSADEVREREAELVLAEAGWGRATAACRALFSATFMPDAAHEELTWFDTFQRKATSPHNVRRFLRAIAEIDVRHRLAEIKVPTLVIHSRGDERIPLSTGCDLAAAIPGAQFMALDSNNHLLTGREPAAAVFIAAVRRFLRATG